MPFKCFASILRISVVVKNTRIHLQADRLRAQSIRDAKKAAKEAKSLGLKQYNAQKKEGEPCRYNIIIFIKHLFSKSGSSCSTRAICRGIIRNRRARDYNSRHDPWGRPCAVCCH
jgi:hypothetical protein